MDAKLNLLEVAVLDVCATNPEFNVKIYLGMCELVYAEEFPVNKIEKVVDVMILTHFLSLEPKSSMI